MTSKLIYNEAHMVVLGTICRLNFIDTAVGLQLDMSYVLML